VEVAWERGVALRRLRGWLLGLESLAGLRVWPADRGMGTAPRPMISLRRAAGCMAWHSDRAFALWLGKVEEDSAMAWSGRSSR
jgi:hypothetical protein